jgi:predicted transcriptional regulator
MKESNTKTKLKERLEWRRNKVSELSVKGFSQVEIARMLQISEPTISRDIEYLRQEANETIKNHIQKKLPYEYSKTLQGIEEIIKESWIVCINADKKGDTKEKLQSLALIKDTYNTKMDLLTNASLLQDSIKFVEEHKEKLPMVKLTEGEKGDLEEGNGLEGLTEDYTDQSTTEEQYNEVF